MARTEEIIQAALRLFAEKGYDATSIQDITAAVNIKKATFYSHFPSKKELYIQIMEEQARILIDKTQATLRNSKAADLKALLFDVFDAQVRNNFDRTNLLFWKRTLLAQTREDIELQADLTRIMERVNDVMVSSISTAIKNVCPGITPKYISCCMFMYFVFLQGYLDWIIITNKTDEAHVKYSWDCFWNGLQGVTAK